MRILPLIVIILLFYSCAQVVPLSGGDPDRTAPQLVSANPENKTLNFNSEVIILKFNEYIQLKDITNQLIITPSVSELPDITVAGKTLTIKFKDKLQDATTYRLFFGNAITDITEGNPLKDFEYIFSTGSYIDSLNISGILTDALTKAPVKDAWVMLYSNIGNDSVIYKEKPDYLSRSKEGGHYYVGNLPSGKFRIIALSDKNKNLMYDNGELFGFKEEPISIPNIDSLSIRLFTEKSTVNFIKKTDHSYYEKVIVIMNTGIDDLKYTDVYYTNGKPYPSFSYRINKARDSVSYYLPGPSSDSLYFKLMFDNGKKDSSLVTFISEEKLKEQFNRKRMPLEITSPYSGTAILPYFLPAYKFKSSFSLKSLQKENLIIKENGKQLDTSAYRIKQTNADSFSLFYKWKQELEYEIILAKGFATDYHDRENDSTSFKFTTNSAGDYGSLKLTVSGIANGNYILQAMNLSGIVLYEKQVTVDSNDTILVVFDTMLPETYRFKLIADANNDKAFTPGAYLKKSQPEKVFISDQTIKIIEEWDNELNWKLKSTN